MKRDHGKHNKRVCDKLHLQEEYKCNDWVVTTSFYSSIHFIDHALFPCDYKGNRLNNINDAHSVIRANSKHQTRAILLEKLRPKHKGDYSLLISESQNARYVNYQISDPIATRAVAALGKIITSYDKDKGNIGAE